MRVEPRDDAADVIGDDGRVIATCWGPGAAETAERFARCRPLEERLTGAGVLAAHTIRNKLRRDFASWWLAVSVMEREIVRVLQEDGAIQLEETVS